MIVRFPGLASLALIALAGCATTQEASVEERAYCQGMAERMGLETTHDHGAMRGSPPNSMNISHERCQQIMREDRPQD
jgi:hypothetical protein